MKYSKEKSNFGPRIYLEEEDKYLCVSFEGNLDLYWSFHNNKGIDESNEFIIAKENYGVYRLFDELFYDIENINFDYLDEEAKDRIRSINESLYNDLYNKDNNTITWYSDETSSKVSNYVEIKKLDETFNLKFNIQAPIKGYDFDFHSNYYIPIRFRNSGSSYDPFNVFFMKMYNDLDKIDDVNDIGHQIYIEEYLYNKRLVKK